MAYLTIEQTAHRLGADAGYVGQLVAGGQLPSLRSADGVRRIPEFAVETYLLTMSSQAMLVIRCPEDLELTAPRTRTGRIEAFTARTSSTPEGFLADWNAGRIDPTLDHAELAVEAEELAAVSR